MSGKYVPLGEVATLQAGVGFPLNIQGRSSGSYPFAKVGDISRCGRTGNSILSSADHYVEQADIDNLRAKLVPAGSVLFAKIGEAIRQNHRVIAGCDMLIDNNAMAAIPSEKIDGRFLYNFLKTVDFYCLAPATTVPALRKSDLERLPIPLPPLPEQIRIAATLDQADALRVKRRSSLVQLDSLTKAIFIDMFGDPASNPKGWHTKQLSELIVDGDTINYGVVQPGDDVIDGIPLIRVGDLNEGRVSHAALKKISPSIESAYKRSRLHGDEILVSCVGSIGVVALANASVRGFNIARAVARIRLSNKANREYMAAHLQSDSVQRYFTKELRTVSQPTLNIKQISETVVMCPPIEMQLEFAARCSKVGEIKLVYDNSRIEFDNLFASLQHSAFRREL